MTDPSSTDGPEKKLGLGRSYRGTSFSDFPGRLTSLSGRDCVKLGIVESSGSGSSMNLRAVDLWGNGDAEALCVEPRIAAQLKQKEREAERGAREAEIRAELAQLAAATDAIFPSSYAGLVLRAVTVGKFELVPEVARAVTSEHFDATSSLFGVDRNDPFVQLLEGAMNLTMADGRKSSVFTAYAVGRVVAMDSCGERMTVYTQDIYHWEDYFNALGQNLSSSAKQRVTLTAEVPSKFDIIIKFQNTIESPFLIAPQVAAILNRLSCESPVRQQLEDNLVAYFKGASPVHTGPVPGN